MIMVDSSVWIDYFNGIHTPQTDFLDHALGNQPIQIGDLMLAEVLQGFRLNRDFQRARAALLRFNPVPILSVSRAVQSAQNFRTLRKKGVTIRKTIDCLIATFCIETQTNLLHSDRDFDPFEDYLGLSVVHC